MLSKNKDYQAIIKTEPVIQEAIETKNSIDALNREIEALRTKSYETADPSMPYGEMLTKKQKHLESVEHTIKRRIVLRLIPYIVLILGVPLGVTAVLNVSGTYAWVATNSPLNVYVAQFILLALLYLLALIILIKTLGPLALRSKEAVFKSHSKRFDKQNRQRFSEAFSNTEEQIEAQKKADTQAIKEKINDRDQREAQLSEFYTTIENQCGIPRRFINQLPIIKQYFEEYRAEKTKEAINLLIQEERMQSLVANFNEQMNIQTQAIQSLKERLDRLFDAVEGKN